MKPNIDLIRVQRYFGGRILFLLYKWNSKRKIQKVAEILQVQRFVIQNSRLKIIGWGTWFITQEILWQLLETLGLITTVRLGDDPTRKILTYSTSTPVKIRTKNTRIEYSDPRASDWSGLARLGWLMFGFGIPHWCSIWYRLFDPLNDKTSESGKHMRWSPSSILSNPFEFISKFHFKFKVWSCK